MGYEFLEAFSLIIASLCIVRMAVTRHSTARASVLEWRRVDDVVSLAGNSCMSVAFFSLTMRFSNVINHGASIRVLAYTTNVK